MVKRLITPFQLPPALTENRFGESALVSLRQH